MFTVTDRLREGCHILSATTGRLKDMVEKGRVRRNLFFEMKFSKFQFLDFIKKSEIFRS
jgi:superfamily II DNA/RNA helicase